MDTFQFVRPNARVILHHARCQTEARTLAEIDAEAAGSRAAQPPAHRARHAREVLERAVTEHALNRKAELFIPRVQPTADSAPAAAFDPLDYFARLAAAPPAATSSSVAPSSFSFDATVPFSALLSDAFLTRLLRGSVFGVSLATSIDHTNAVQLTPPGLLRMYVDTDSFEALGIDVPTAHSEFPVCSQKGARSQIRERLMTIDLAEYAKQVAMHTSADATTTTATKAPAAGESKEADQETAVKNKGGDKKLARLRWALDRCAPIRMRWLFLDEHGRCEEMPPLEGVTDVKRIAVAPKVHQFGVKGHTVSVPDVRAFSTLLPSLTQAMEADAAKQAAKKQKHSTAPESTEESKASDSVAPSSVGPSSSSTSVFPLLADGTCAQEIWSDMMTYLGLVSGRMESSLADPNNTSGTNLFLQQPLCPYLNFHRSTSSSASADAAAASSLEAEGEPMAEDGGAAADEDENMISLTSSKKKPKPPKRKRNASGATDAAAAASASNSASDGTPLAPVASAHALTWSGLLAPSTISSILARARSLLAGDSSIPFLALTVHGFDSALTSWREKQHQVWMAGSQGGGGENHYTVILLPESHEERKRQQYVLCTMLGELDRTH